MLQFSISIKNPFVKSKLYELYSKSGDFGTIRWLHEHAWEIELWHDDTYWFNFDVNLAWRGNDHAGPRIRLAVATIVLEMSIYSVLHWDYAKGTWQEIDEDPSEYKANFVGDKK